MKHPLVEACLEVARAGYEQRDKLEPGYCNPRLFALADFLLSNSGLGRGFRTFSNLPNLPVRSKNELALMFGAGIDSYCALVHAVWGGTKVHLVYVDYGQPYAYHERAVFNEIKNGCCDAPAAGTFLSDLHDYADLITFHEHKIDLVTDKEKTKDLAWKDYIFPARNLVLASIGSQHAQVVWIVANKRADETVGTPDKTTRFYREASVLFSQFYGYPILVESPFMAFSKKEVVDRYLQGGGNVEALKATFSCYSPAPAPEPPPYQCGVCYACYKRFKLFQDLNVAYSFRTHPQKGPNFDEYEAKERAKGR